jgi:hypothetical protein
MPSIRAVGAGVWADSAIDPGRRIKAIAVRIYISVDISLLNSTIDTLCAQGFQDSFAGCRMYS